MNKITKTLAVCLSVLSLSACTVNTDGRVKSELKKIKRGPVNAPYKSITNFSKALRCMDNLMVAHRIRNIPILVEAIDDKTESVKAGTRDMLMSAISEMTIRSRGIKVIAYGKDATNLLSYMKSSNRKGIFKHLPRFDIQGSISQYDENIVNASSSSGISAGRKAGIGNAKSSSASVIALDLNVIDTRDLSVVPGVNSRNSIAIFKSGKSFDADAGIKKFGIYYDISLNRTEGKTQALRNLVELGAIETIGKLVRVPYWRCLGASDHKILKTSVGYLFNKKSPNRAIKIRKAKATQNRPKVILTKGRK